MPTLQKGQGDIVTSLNLEVFPRSQWRGIFLSEAMLTSFIWAGSQSQGEHGSWPFLRMLGGGQSSPKATFIKRETTFLDKPPSVSIFTDIRDVALLKCSGSSPTLPMECLLCLNSIVELMEFHVKLG